MAKYQKKPVVIDAIQWTGNNLDVMDLFIRGKGGSFSCENDKLFIETLEGTMEASKGDFIIRGVRGEYYPCKPDIFEETYEKVDKWII